ncbi:hypothetical protein H0Z11_04205 [Pantoea agglomerans]|nr:hypothetical protein [Pantoea agglomerans]QTC51088.1 hypothetical protein H0Z11_04205 [Pantoea agglomerans]
MNANDEKWLGVLRQMVSGHSTQAYSIWDRLSEHQRGIILHAAGLKARHCRYSWGQFTDHELHQIKRGLQRLKCMVEMFKGLGPLAFQQEKKPSPSVLNAARSVPTVPGTPVHDLIKARQQLRKPANNRAH